MSKELIGQWLEGREMIYNLLSLLFYRGPEDNILNPLLEINFLQQLGEDLEHELMSEACLEMHEELTGKLQDGNYRDGLWDEYNRLFVGPGPLEAPPWESVYRSKERLLFGDETLAVREFYQNFGLGVKEKNKEPDDHIGLEMEFMAFLSKEAAELNQQDEDITPFMDASKRFIKDHLKEWVPYFCYDLEDKAQTRFFQGLAKLTRGWLELDEMTLAKWEQDF